LTTQYQPCQGTADHKARGSYEQHDGQKLNNRILSQPLKDKLQSRITMGLSRSRGSHMLDLHATNSISILYFIEHVLLNE